MILKLNLWRFKLGFSLFLQGKEKVYGYTNRCSDGKFIVFLDYDDMPFEWVYDEIMWLQTDFNLGNFYLFKSSKDSYHAVCFSKLRLNELMKVIYNSSIDENYHRIPYTIGKRLLTLRASDKKNSKIKFECCLVNDSNRLESKEHKLVFNKLFPNVLNEKQIEVNNDLGHPSKVIFSHYKIK